MRAHLAFLRNLGICRNSRFSISRNRSIRQFGKIQFARANRSIRHTILSIESSPLLHAGKGAVPWAIQTHAYSPFHSSSSRQRPSTALLHAEHRFFGGWCRFLSQPNIPHFLCCMQTEAGLPKEKVVAAHGNFDSATCISTGRSVPIEEVREAIMGGDQDGWKRLRDRHGGLVRTRSFKLRSFINPLSAEAKSCPAGETRHCLLRRAAAGALLSPCRCGCAREGS